MTVYVKDIVYRLIFMIPSTVITFALFPYVSQSLDLCILSLITCTIAIISTFSLLLKLSNESPDFDKVKHVLDKPLFDRRSLE